MNSIVLHCIALAYWSPDELMRSFALAKIMIEINPNPSKYTSTGRIVCYELRCIFLQNRNALPKVKSD